MTVALIVAAGSGERLGAGVPKALVELAGRTLLQWSIDAIAAVQGIEMIVLAQATDDAWLVERAGGKVIVVPASEENIKVTTPLDLEVAELLLARRLQAGRFAAAGGANPA